MKNFGTYFGIPDFGDGMFQALQEFAKQNDSKIRAKKFQNSFVIAKITPFMERKST